MEKTEKGGEKSNRKDESDKGEKNKKDEYEKKKEKRKTLNVEHKTKEKFKSPRSPQVPPRLNGSKKKKSKQQRIPPKVIDPKPLEEFLAVMDEWHKSANSQPSASSANSTSSVPKKDARFFADVAGKTLVKFVVVNNLTEKTNDLVYLDAAHIAAQAASEESTKILEKLRNQRHALKMCGSISQLLRQFLHSFVVFYHTLASDHPSCVGGDSVNINVQLKNVYESIEEELGCTLDEEYEIYRSLPIRGEFPPPDYRTSNYDETEQKMLPEFARPAEDRLSTLPVLLRRLQGELVFRSTFINIPDLDDNSLIKIKNSPDLKAALSLHIASKIEKMYGFNWRGGNLFAAIRSAMCFLLHAQTTLDVFSKIPLFYPLLASTIPSSGRHTLDLPHNLRVASSHQSGKPVTINAVNDLTFINKRSTLLTYDSGKTIGDMMKELEQRPALQSKTRTDVVHAFVAMFFDTPFAVFKREFENQLRCLQNAQYGIFPSLLHFAPVFLYQDTEFLAEYFARNPSSEYSRAFLASSVKTASKKEKEEKPDLSDFANKSTVVITKIGKDTVASVGINPHKYNSDNASLFSFVGENSHPFMEAVHQLENVPPSEKAELLSSLLRQSTGPDNLSTAHSSDSSDFEEKSINFVYRRNITSGIFEMLRSSLRTVNTYAYPFYQQQEITTHTEELTGRFASLLLGYSHAFSYEERPKDKMFLDIDLIIPFLYRYQHAMLDTNKHKQRILGIEFEFHKSPLVQAVFNIARGQNNNTKSDNNTKSGLEAHAVIAQLHSLWEESKIDPRALHDLNNFIIKLVTPTRYDQDQIREFMKAPVDAAELQVRFWSTCEKNISAYEVFLNAHANVLSDQSATVAENLCPHVTMVTPNQNVDVDDAQLPSEIF